MRPYLVLCCLLIANLAVADTYYVNNQTGSDFNTGTVETGQGDDVGPLKSIAASLKRANRGDVIVLANTGQAYKECITLQGARHSGTSFDAFTIEGNGATLDGTEVVPPTDWEYVGEEVFRFRPERGGTQRLFLDGDLATQMFRYNGRYNGRYISSMMKPKQWCACNGNIQFAVEKDKHPTSYELRYAKHPVGITLYDVERVVIRDLTVKGFKLDGINAHDNAMDCVLAEINAVANGRSGISIGGASRVHVVDCLARDNGVAQLRTEGWSTTKLVRTKLVSTNGPLWSRDATQHGQGARLFVDDQRQTELHGWPTKEMLEAEQKAAEAKAKADEDDDAAAEKADDSDPDDESANDDDALKLGVPGDSNTLPDVDDPPTDDAADKADGNLDPFGDEPMEDVDPINDDGDDLGDAFGDDAFEDDAFGDDMDAEADEEDPFDGF